MLKISLCQSPQLSIYQLHLVAFLLIQNFPTLYQFPNAPPETMCAFPNSPSLAKFLKSIISIEFSWKGRSTVVPLTLATHHWHKSLESKHQVACIFVDYNKGFDSIPLLALLQWIEDYLSQSFKRVTLNGQCSTWLPVYSLEYPMVQF